jgi:hypothetical protein
VFLLAPASDRTALKLTAMWQALEGCRLPTLSKDALIMRLIPVVVLLLPFALGGCASFSSSPPPPASNTTIIAPPGTTPGRY